MTKEVAKSILYVYRAVNLVDAGHREAFDMAIKALEQESVLDKIRAEIEDIAFDWQEIDGEHENFIVVDLNDVLQIIDKYKAESEEQE